MSSLFPGDFDTFVTIVDASPLVSKATWTKMNSAVITPLQEAIVAIQHNIGNNADGEYDDIAARLDAFDDHKATHIYGGDDEIDGDRIGISWTPSTYTASATPTAVSSVYELTAHLYGIDQYLSSLGTMEGAYDLDGERLTFDGDADTYVDTATDDVLKFYIAGALDFQFSANTFTAETGSKIVTPKLESSGAALNINYGIDQNVVLFDGVSQGETPSLQVVGYRTGDAERVLDISVGADAADTASFSGLSTYYFQGSVKVYNGWVSLGSGSTITLSQQTGNSIEVTEGFHRISAFNSTDPNTVTTITNAETPPVGALLYLMMSSSSTADIRLDVGGTGFKTSGNITLDSSREGLLFVWNGSEWCQAHAFQSVA